MMTQQTYFKILMYGVILGVIEDLLEDTDHHEIFFAKAVQGCLARGIPQEHAVNVLTALAELISTVDLEYTKIAQSGNSAQELN